MVIFHSYVSLPEGNTYYHNGYVDYINYGNPMVDNPMSFESPEYDEKQAVSAVRNVFLFSLL